MDDPIKESACGNCLGQIRQPSIRMRVCRWFVVPAAWN